MIYFYSDPHFFHDNIIRLGNRPFADREDMHRSLTDRYNALVTDDDDVYFLGDLAFNRKKIKTRELKGSMVSSIIRRLGGRKYLVTGNHDDWLMADPSFDRSVFSWIAPSFEFSSGPWKLLLVHDPADYLHDPETGADPKMILADDEILIYGHVHQNTPPDAPARSACVCVEQIDYAPISVDSAIDLALGSAG
ncbi:MAG: metallophosphoesterase family protein [Succinivibrionaceae bacterium]|nr:metallophosphoesterase family protein [Succinivibrionaceae bacterium]